MFDMVNVAPYYTWSPLCLFFYLITFIWLMMPFWGVIFGNNRKRVVVPLNGVKGCPQGGNGWERFEIRIHNGHR